jgi:hypothetical protein
VAAGGRPVLETASELADEGVAPPLAAALRALALAGAEAGLEVVPELLAGLADAPRHALESLAVVLLVSET